MFLKCFLFVTLNGSLTAIFPLFLQFKIALDLGTINIKTNNGQRETLN